MYLNAKVHTIISINFESMMSTELSLLKNTMYYLYFLYKYIYVQMYVYYIFIFLKL